MEWTPETLKTLGLLIVAIMVMVVVPLAFVFTEHQRKMIKILRGQNDEEPGLVKMLFTEAPKAEEIRELRQRISALEADVAALKAQQPPKLEGETLKSRLG